MTEHASIHAFQMGDFVGEQRPRSLYPGEVDECPECGGQKMRKAKVCKKCHTLQVAERRVDPDRRERFELALLAGWTLEDIYGFDPSEEYDPERDKLPSRREIVARMIKNWCK